MNKSSQHEDVAGRQSGAALHRGGVCVPADLNHTEDEELDWGRVFVTAPEEVMELVKIPHIELVVEGPGKHHTNKVAHEEGQ